MSSQNYTPVAKIIFHSKEYPRRLSVKLCNIDNKIFLRWFPPKSIGFPYFFEIYKLSEDEWNYKVQRKSIKFRNIIINQNPPSFNYFSQKIKDDFTIFYNGEMNYFISNKNDALHQPDRDINDNEKYCSIRFIEPLVYLQIKSNLLNDGIIRCFYKSKVISTQEMSEDVIFEVPNITEVLIPLCFDYIEEINYITESSIINKLTSKIETISVPTLDNTSPLITQLKKTQANPTVRENIPAKDGQLKSSVSTLDYLNLVSLKPDIAQMFGLNWIDEESREDNYLYVVKACYSKDRGKMHKYDCYGFEFAKNIEEKPFIEKLTIEQLSGITFDNKNRPLGQIALTWKYGDNRAVFYEVKRLNKANEEMSIAYNHMVSRSSKYCFQESNLPLNDIIYYQVTPIDIFGRRGDTTECEIVLTKTFFPVPPKNIKAKILQNGFPWNDVKEYKDLKINEGLVHLSFEYGEQQHLVSANAEKVTLLYRIGDRVENDDWENIDKWEKLDSIRIKPPIKAEVVFENSQDMTTFSFEIKKIILKEKVKEIFVKEDVDSRFYKELLLNETLLEPNIFKDFTFIYNSQEFIVVDSHAGLAYDLDTSSDKRYTTRLIVEDVNNLLISNKEVHLIASTSSESLLHLNLDKPISNFKELSGGEMALENEFYNDGKLLYQTLLGKVVSDIKEEPNNGVSVIVRLNDKEFVNLLKEEEYDRDGIQIAVRYYAPYLLSYQKLILNSSSRYINKSISIKIDKDKAFETVWFSAITHPKREEKNISPLAIPFEVKVMNSPEILAEIPIPKLCKNTKYAPPSNMYGYSNPIICWESDLEGVKYELSRALDKTIIATDKKNWLQGLDSIVSTTSPKVFKGVFDNGFNKDKLRKEDSIDVFVGTFTIPIKLSSNDKILLATLKQMEKGRIKVKNTYYQLLKVISEDDVTKLLCKPFSDIKDLKPIADGTPFNVEGVPNYSNIENDDEILKELADISSNQSAFGLISSVATKEKYFTDTIPAKGSNRFFYKLRVVFASGHKSAWSKCSEGVYQFPSAPKQIENFTVIKYKEQYMVSWEKPLDSNIDGYLFYKKEEDETLTELKDVKSNELIFKPRFIPENLLIFSKPILIGFSSENLENKEEIESYLLTNISIVGLKEDSSLETRIYKKEESSFLYEIKKDTYHIKGLKQCSENLADFEKVKVSVIHPEKSFEEIVGRDENVYVVHLEEEELKKDELVVVPYVEVNRMKIVGENNA